MDIVYNGNVYQVDKNNFISVKSLQSELIGNLTLYDFNNDGIEDVFVYNSERKELKQFRNNGNFNFQFENSYQFQTENMIGFIDVVDLNDDGTLEIIADEYTNDFTSKLSLNVYTINQNEIHLKKILDKRPENYGYYRLIQDFDGDNKNDIYVGGKLYYYRDFSFLPGLNYDPSHNGHGFSIEPVGSLGEFYTVFYTYDKDGFPEWYSDLGVFNQPLDDYWNITSNEGNFIRYQYDYILNTVSINQDNEQKGDINHQQCSDTYGEIKFNWKHNYNPTTSSFGEEINWCSHANIPYEQRPNHNISGLWWAGNEDSGWGWSMSLQERIDNTALVVVLYYYDAQGNPRWLIGVQEGFEFGQEITVNMNMVKGYARTVSPVDLTSIPAGTMRFTIEAPLSSESATGVLSMDVSYPGVQGGRWLRENLAISRQSNNRR